MVLFEDLHWRTCFSCKKHRSTQIWNPSSMYILVCSTHLMSIRLKMQEARERLKKTRSLCVACCLLGMFRSRQCRFPANKTPTTTPHPFDAATIKVTASFIREKITQDGWHVSWQPCFTCPLKHAAGGVICQGASMLPTSYWHGCRLQLLFQTVLPTYKLQLVFLSVSCRLLSRNSVQARTCHWNQLNFSDTSASWAHERISLFNNIYRQGNLVKLCIFWVGRRPSYTGAVFNSSGARLRELCQWGGTKLSQGDFLLAHYH